MKKVSALMALVLTLMLVVPTVLAASCSYYNIHGVHQRYNTGAANDVITYTRKNISQHTKKTTMTIACLTCGIRWNESVTVTEPHTLVSAGQDVKYYNITSTTHDKYVWPKKKCTKCGEVIPQTEANIYKQTHTFRTTTEYKNGKVWRYKKFCTQCGKTVYQYK